MIIKSFLIIFAVIILNTGCSKKKLVTQYNTVSSQSETTMLADSTSVPEINSKADIQSVPTPETNSDESIAINKKRLAGKVICIDPGHGNPNHIVQNEPIAPSSKILKPATAYGTAGVSTKIPEYKLTMTVSVKIRDLLINEGATVVMTRESNDVDLGNVERSEIANKVSSDIAIRIHADGYDNPSVEGISVLYPGSEYVKDAEILRKSKAAAQLTLEELIKCTNGKSRGIVERNDLTGFNWTTVPVILVEMGFMTNPSEDTKLNSEDYQNKIAEGIVNGLMRYLDIK